MEKAGAKPRIQVLIRRMEKREAKVKNVTILPLLGGVGLFASLATACAVSKATEKPAAPSQAAKRKAYPHQEHVQKTKSGERFREFPYRLVPVPWGSIRWRDGTACGGKDGG